MKPHKIDSTFWGCPVLFWSQGCKSQKLPPSYLLITAEVPVQVQGSRLHVNPSRHRKPLVSFPPSRRDQDASAQCQAQEHLTAISAPLLPHSSFGAQLVIFQINHQNTETQISQIFRSTNYQFWFLSLFPGTSSVGDGENLGIFFS